MWYIYCRVDWIHITIGISERRSVVFCCLYGGGVSIFKCVYRSHTSPDTFSKGNLFHHSQYSVSVMHLSYPHNVTIRGYSAWVASNVEGSYKRGAVLGIVIGWYAFIPVLIIQINSEFKPQGESERGSDVKCCVS